MLNMLVRVWHTGKLKVLLRADIPTSNLVKKSNADCEVIKSTETGIIECRIRLPCDPNHTVGSACIATWLKSNNSCPLCRHEFFPRQPRPYLEHGIMENESLDFYYPEIISRLAVRSESSGLVEPLCLRYGYLLGLHIYTIRLSQGIGGGASELAAVNGRSEVAIAATSIYIASHFLGDPRSLTEVAQVAGVNEGTIHNLYRQFQSQPQLPTPEELREDLGIALRTHGASAPALPTYPPLDHDFGQFENSQDVERVAEILSPIPRELLLPSTLARTTHRLARKLEYMASFTAESPPCLAAVCLYMAAWLTWEPLALNEILQATRVTKEEVHALYSRIYPVRAQLIDIELINIINLGNRQDVYARFPSVGYTMFIFSGAGEIISDTVTARVRGLKRLCSDYCEELDLPGVIEMHSHFIVDKAARVVSPWNRRAISAASVYWASNISHHRTMEHVATIAGLSVSDLHDAYEFIRSDGRMLVEWD